MSLTYRKVLHHKRAILLFLSFLLFLLFVFSVSIGTATLSLRGILNVLYLLFNPSANTDPLIANILFTIRLPRVLMAVVAGACFGVAGAVLQTVLRNPLASPYTIGVASASAFGAALAIILGAGIIGWHGTYIIYTNPYVITLNAFIFAIIAVALTAILAFYKGVTPGTIILSGIAVMYIFSALTSLLQYFGTSEQVAAPVFWMFGDLGKAEWLDVELSFIVLSIGVTVLILLSRSLDAVIIGDDVAKSLGVNVKILRTLVLIMAALLTATPIAFIGTIGFIGLLAPHIARFLVGASHKYLVACSALTGSILLLLADTISRTILSPLILPVGIFTAFMGVPLFLYLLFKRGRYYW